MWGQLLYAGATPFFRKSWPVLVCLAEMEFRDAPHILCTGYQADLRATSQHGYPIEMGSDVDTETEGGASPDRALRMWMTEMKSEHSSCLSSRANSALSLTDTDHERKSEGENGNRAAGALLVQRHGLVPGCPPLLWGAPYPG